MIYVKEDARYDENHTLTGIDDSGELVTFSPDTSGDYVRKIDSDGYDVIEDSDDNTIAHVE